MLTLYALVLSYSCRHAIRPSERLLKRYKKDTDCFVTWFADTAVKFGLRLSTTTETPASDNGPIRQGPRLKGKARKVAREQHERMHTQASPAAKRLTTNQLLECTKNIASARPQAFRVPNFMYNALLSALERRTKFTLWFEKQEQCTGNEDTQQSNATHGVFNSTLEAIRKLLEPFVERPPNPKLAPGKPRSATQVSANLFDSLAEISLTDDEDDEKPSSAPKAKRPCL